LKAVCKVSSSSFSPASMAGGVSTVHPPSCSHTHTHTHTHKSQELLLLFSHSGPLGLL
jgi:hypothetical protein